jgi:uncharacterized protein involved in high-affinity Fe2+ transport
MIMGWRGPLTALAILGGVALILILNIEPGGDSGRGGAATPTTPRIAPKPTAGMTVTPGRPLEHPIGDEVVKNQIQIAAVWLASVGMDGQPISEAQSMIHLEADVRSTANNPNGFAKDEFIPYLMVRYEIVPAGTNRPIQGGEMLPMVAFDGLHYGANIDRPAPGTYRLIYRIDPPSASGLGRHSDPVTGVAPWWDAFTAEFEWTVGAD